MREYFKKNLFKNRKPLHFQFNMSFRGAVTYLNIINQILYF